MMSERAVKQVLAVTDTNKARAISSQDVVEFMKPCVNEMGACMRDLQLIQKHLKKCGSTIVETGSCSFWCIRCAICVWDTITIAPSASVDR